MLEFRAGGLTASIVQNGVPTTTTSHLHVHDMLYRTYRDTSSSSMMVASWKTEDIVSQLSHWQVEKDLDIATLKTVLCAQHRYIEYQAVYSAYLLGAISEEEFETDSDKFICEPKNIPVTELASTISRIDRLLDFTLQAVELAEYLEVDLSVVEEAILEVSNNITRNKERGRELHLQATRAQEHE